MSAVKLSKLVTSSHKSSPQLKQVPSTTFSNLGLKSSFSSKNMMNTSFPIQANILKTSSFKTTLGKTSSFHTSKWTRRAEEPKPEGEQQANGEAAGQQQQQPLSEVDQLKQQIAELESKLKYSLAERENMRRIRDLDVDKAKEFGIQKFAKEILDVADNLNRCIENVPKEGLGIQLVLSHVLTYFDGNTSLLLEGVKMTEAGLEKVLKAHGVEKFSALGEKFDPNKMNALMQMQAPGKDPNTVGLVFKSGYLIKGKILRPADVGVVTA